jgi:hypothetical protein
MKKKESENAGNFKSKSTVKITATETSRKVEFDIPEYEVENVTAGLIKNNHLRGLYSDYCILNQEFLKYVLSCNLTGSQSKIFHFLLSKMDRENKVLASNDYIIRSLNLAEKTAITSIQKLIDCKIILKQRLDRERYVIDLNYDILNPQLAFKNKSSKENVLKHKALINQETPYFKQTSIDGMIDYVNPNTGEVFYSEKNNE